MKDGAPRGAVVVQGRAVPIATVGGWGDIPLARAPLQATPAVR